MEDDFGNDIAEENCGVHVACFLDGTYWIYLDGSIVGKADSYEEAMEIKTYYEEF